MSASQYDRTYFENGVAARVSGYTNYHWRPEYSLPFANELKRRFVRRTMDGEPFRVLDYGCAKGFLVKALRLLGVDAFGYDISEYAIEHADPAVRNYVSTATPDSLFRLIVSKDVMEHVPKDEMTATLRNIFHALHDFGTAVITVPLGDDNQYRIREYELDSTHQIRENEEWWIDYFRGAGLRLSEFYYDFPGAKDHWLKVHPHGNGTFILRKQKP